MTAVAWLGIRNLNTSCTSTVSPSLSQPLNCTATCQSVLSKTTKPPQLTADHIALLSLALHDRNSASAMLCSSESNNSGQASDPSMLGANIERTYAYFWYI